MRYFKQPFFYFCLFFIGYAILSIFSQVIDEKKENSLPQNFFLKTPNSLYSFGKKKTNTYCLPNSICGILKEGEKEYFDFVFFASLSTTFMSTKDPQIFKTKPVYYPNYIKTLNSQEVTFPYKSEENKLTTIKCTLNSKYCSINNKKTDFSLIGGGVKLNKTKPFDSSFSLKTSQRLFFKNKENNVVIIEKQDDETYQTIPFQQKNSQKQHRFLLLLSSYKRPIYLVNNVHKLLKQNYKNFNISISLKGINERVVNQFILADIQPYIQEKKVIFQQHTNSHQFKNLLNTFRNIDLSAYDYLCKIDDDDWYSPDYLKTINLIINALDNPEFIVSNEMVLLNNEKNQLYLKKETLANMGGTICFNQNFAKELLRIEKLSDSEILKIIPSDTNMKAPYFANFEDRFINAIAHFRGNKAIYFSFKPLFIYNKQTPSVTRFK